MTKGKTKRTETTFRKWMRQALSLAVLVVGLLAARSSLADHYFVPSGSMRPTLQEGDDILVLKLAYGVRAPFSHWYIARFEGPVRGDVVVLDSPADGVRLVKRVVGLPGDVIQVRGGTLFVDGEAVPIEPGTKDAVEVLDDRPHLLSFAYGGGPDLGPLEIPADRYLVLGDNRGNSADGRMFGLVPFDHILGRAVAIWFRDGRPIWIPL